MATPRRMLRSREEGPEAKRERRRTRGALGGLRSAGRRQARLPGRRGERSRRCSIGRAGGGGGGGEAPSLPPSLPWQRPSLAAGGKAPRRREGQQPALARRAWPEEPRGERSSAGQRFCVPAGRADLLSAPPPPSPLPSAGFACLDLLEGEEESDGRVGAPRGGQVGIVAGGGRGPGFGGRRASPSSPPPPVLEA